MEKEEPLTTPQSAANDTPREVVTREHIVQYVTAMQEDDPELIWAGNIVKAILIAPMREDQLLHVLFGLSRQDGNMQTIFHALCALTLGKTIQDGFDYPRYYQQAMAMLGDILHPAGYLIDACYCAALDGETCGICKVRRAYEELERVRPLQTSQAVASATFPVAVESPSDASRPGEANGLTIQLSCHKACQPALAHLLSEKGCLASSQQSGILELVVSAQRWNADLYSWVEDAWNCGLVREVRIEGAAWVRGR